MQTTEITHMAELIERCGRIRGYLRLLLSGREYFMALHVSLELMNDLRQKIECDLKMAKEYDLESVMWKSCVQVPVGAFRKRLKEEKGGKMHKDNLSAFHNCVREYMNVYRSMLSRAMSGGNRKSKRKDDVKDSLYRYNIFLGDLARYKELHSLNRKKLFKEAMQYYKKARSVVPYRGNPYNQLAVIASYESKSLDAFYFYIRALCCKIPFPNAKENMNQFIDAVLRNRSRYLVKDRYSKLDAMLPSTKSEIDDDKEVRKKIRRSARTSIATFYASVLSLDSPPRDGKVWNLLYSGALDSARFLLDRNMFTLESSVQLLATCIYSCRYAVSERATEHAVRFLIEFLGLALLRLEKNTTNDDVSLGTIRVFTDWCCRGDLHDSIRALVSAPKNVLAVKFWTRLCEMVNEHAVKVEDTYRFASPEHLTLKGYSLIDTSSYEEMSETSSGGREKHNVLSAQRWYAIRINIERIADESDTCCVYPIEDDLMLSFTTDRMLYLASRERVGEQEEEEEEEEDDDEEVIVFSPESRRRKHQNAQPTQHTEQQQSHEDATLSLIEKLRISSRNDYKLF